MNFEVLLLENVVEFIMKLPEKMQAKIQRSIGLLKEFGYNLPEPHSKKIKGSAELYELRVKVASDNCRLFYFHWKNNVYIVTSGYIKKTNKISKNEIKIAENLMNEFKENDNG